MMSSEVVACCEFRTMISSLDVKLQNGRKEARKMREEMSFNAVWSSEQASSPVLVSSFQSV